MNALLVGRTAIVSGAGGGVGRGIAQALALAGANVVIAARRAATGDATAELIHQAGGSALSIATDVTRREHVDHVIERAVAAFGGLDIVVHNATSGLSGVPIALEDIDDARLTEEASVALDGALYLAQSSFPHLKACGRGRFIVLTSLEAVHGGSMNPVYATVKGGQRGFIKALAREWGAHRILVNGINPNARTETAEEHFRRFPAAREQLQAAIPLQRQGDCRDDIGGAAVALASDLMGFVTGQILNVNGGFFTAL